MRWLTCEYLNLLHNVGGLIFILKTISTFKILKHVNNVILAKFVFAE